MKPRLFRLIGLTIVLLTFFTLAAAQSPKPLIISESTYRMGEPGSCVWWTVVLINPNVDMFARSPTVRITARDAGGELLGTRDKEFPEIGPGGQLAYSDDLNVKVMPATVEFKPLDSRFETTALRARDFENYQPFKFKSARLLCDSNPALSSCRVLGELKNPYNKPTSLMATILFRDKNGRLLGGGVFFIKNVQPNEWTPFDESVWRGGIPGTYSSTEISAFCGWTSHWDDLIK